MNTINAVLKRYVEQQPETYERLIVACLIHSIKFYRAVREHLCPFLENESRYRTDFSIARYNTLYPVIDTHWRLYDNQIIDEDVGIAYEDLRAPLIDQSNASDAGSKIVENINALLAETDVDFYRKIDPALPESPMEGIRPNQALMDGLRDAAFTHWLSRRVAKHYKRDIDHLDLDSHLTLEDARAKLTKAEASIAGTRNNLITFGAVAGGSSYYSAVIPTPLDGLNKLLGGGFEKGEVTMIAGNNGGGKSVLACQLTHHLALMGRKVAFFTTEERPPALVARIVSNALNIKMDEFKQRRDIPPESTEAYLLSNIPDWIRTDPTTAGRFADLIRDIGENIIFVDWAQGQAFNIESHFDLEIDKMVAQGFDPEMIVFDWIGGALAATKDRDKLRHQYIAGVNHIVQHAKRTNRVCVVMAQLNKAKNKGIKQPTMDMMSESLTVTNDVRTWIGISFLKEHESEGGSGTSKNLAERQYLAIGKSRYGPGGFCAVDTFFQFQRFKDPARRIAGGGNPAY